MEAKKTSFVVIAELEVSETHRQEFLDLCQYDSERSVTDEAGCKQFDVLITAEEPQSVVLYEVYDDQAAFDAHLATPHYSKFAAGVEQLGVTKTRIRFFQR